MLTLAKAEKNLLDILPENAEVIGSTENDGFYFFVVDIDDPLEGNLDPFYKVDKKTDEVSDFSPMEFKDSDILMQKLGF